VSPFLPKQSFGRREFAERKIDENVCSSFLDSPKSPICRTNFEGAGLPVVENTSKKEMPLALHWQ
jgi:hypothetical protein